jgi:cation diffusion facilitator family transporter
MDIEQRNRRSALAVNIGLAANIFLAVTKTSVGILGHSPALLAEGINSTSDVAYYIVVAVFMRLARKPADDTHPYGHSQLESIASLVVGSFVITTAIAIFWTAINEVYELLNHSSSFSGASQAAFYIAVLTVVLKIYLYFFTRRIYTETNNPAVLALAYDHRNDILSSASAAVGIFLGMRGYPIFDPLIGALVALLILRTGIYIVRTASADLMDPVPSRALYRKISALLADIPEVRSVEEVHAHRFGPYLVVNVTVGVDGEISVFEGDCIACHIEDTIYRSMELVKRVYVHYHPVNSNLACAGDQSAPDRAIYCDLK